MAGSRRWPAQTRSAGAAPDSRLPPGTDLGFVAVFEFLLDELVRVGLLGRINDLLPRGMR